MKSKLTANSAIAKMENSKPIIVTTGMEDIIPSRVAIPCVSASSTYHSATPVFYITLADRV